MIGCRYYFIDNQSFYFSTLKKTFFIILFFKNNF